MLNPNDLKPSEEKVRKPSLDAYEPSFSSKSRSRSRSRSPSSLSDRSVSSSSQGEKALERHDFEKIRLSRTMLSNMLGNERFSKVVPHYYIRLAYQSSKRLSSYIIAEVLGIRT